MEASFWTMVSTYTDSRWWFELPAPLAATGGLLLCMVAAFRLHQRNPISIMLTALALGGALALLIPGALIAWQPLSTLGIDLRQPGQLPSATFSAVARALDQAMRMGMIGSGLLIVGAFGLWVLSARHSIACPTCGRERHPSWKGICPECRLMEPGASESPLMRLGDPSASGVPITQFGSPEQTELLDGAAADSGWVEVIEGPSGLGERFAIGARLTIGRDPGQCQLVLDDESVSSRHAYIERDRQAYLISDWGSRNGTYVNDELVAQRALRDGDSVRIGRAVLRFSAPLDVETDSAPTELLDAGAAGARLVALNGPGAGATFPLTRLDIQIGRGKQNDIVLDAPTISRHHASVRFDGVDYFLVDADAPNGTWLDESRVLGSVRLRHGQIIRLGGQRLRFDLEDRPNITAKDAKDAKE